MPNQFGPTFVYGTGQVLGPPASLGGVISPAQLAANTNDWSPTGLSGATIIRLSFDTNGRLLTGLTGGADGRIVILENISSSVAYYIVHDSASSTAANRFFIPGAIADATVNVSPIQSILLVYDGTSSRWRAVSFFSGMYAGMSGSVAPAALAAVADTGSSPYLSASDHVHPFPSYAVTSTYVPTLTQSGAVTKTTTYAHYWQIGKLVMGWVTLTCTGAGTTNNAITIGLPVTASSATQNMIGVGYWNDVSPATNYPGVLFLASTTTFNIFRTDNTGASAMGVNPNLALASPDVLYAQFMYEAA